MLPMRQSYRIIPIYTADVSGVCSGLYFPDIERAGVAPYEIKEVKTFNFRQKVAKTKTVTYYE